MKEFMKKCWEEPSSKLILLVSAFLLASSAGMLGYRLSVAMEVQSSKCKLIKMKHKYKKVKCKYKRSKKQYYKLKNEVRDREMDFDHREIRNQYLDRLVNNELSWLTVLVDFLKDTESGTVKSRLSLFSENELHLILEGPSEEAILERLQDVRSRFSTTNFRINHMSVAAQAFSDPDSKVAIVVSVESREVACEK